MRSPCQLLAANALVESQTTQGSPRTVLVEESVATAAKALTKGELDAACFVAAFEEDYLQDLLRDGVCDS